jgi:Sec7-like guanine-nucleotide exchange factor
MRSALTLAPAAATPHAQPLLLLCRTIFDINVVSRSARARTEAKASLQEMLDFVCRRLDDPVVTEEPDAEEGDGEAQAGDGEEKGAPATSGDDESVRGTTGATAAGGEAPAAASSKRKTGSQGSSSNQFLSSLIASVSGPTNKPTAASDWMPSGKISKDFDVNLIDCLLVFRALCRLSTREPDMRSAEPLRAKLFAMELLVDLLESHCARLAKHQPFVELGLRRYLSGALLKNGVSPVPAVNRLAIAAFATLLKWIPGPMKAEIGVIFAKIWLPLVSSKHSTVTMKYQVLTLLWWVTASPQILVDLYVNYDCDVDGIDLFGSLVNALCAILSHTTKTDVRGDAATSGHDGSGGDGGASDDDAEEDGDSFGATVTPCTTSFACFLRDVVNPSAPNATTGPAGAGGSAAAQDGAGGGEGGSTAPSSGTLATNGAMDGNAHVRMTALRAFHALYASLRIWARKDDAVAAAASATAAASAATAAAADAAAASSDAADEDGGEDGEPATDPAPADADDDVVDRIRAARTQKQRIEEAKVAFARKPSKGLAAFEELGLVEHTAVDIAALFRKMDGLDMTSIGAYIGLRHDFNREVLSHYVASFDFTSMELDLAMRKFLSTFRLPGEAEIVDRILERFAERYFEQNRTSVFENADTAYVMAFSIMMLSTDLHNPSQKKKMTAEEWLSNNKKYVPGLDKNWNQEYMEELFARIAATPFELQGATSTAATPFQSSNSSIARQALFMADAREMVRAGSSMIRQQANGSVDSGAGYVQASHAEHAEGMFETLAFPGIAAISMLLESSLSSSNLIFNMCLRCICEGAEVAVIFGLDTQRATYVTTLAKRTGLLVGSVESIPRLNRRHLIAVRALMSLAFSAGDGFKVSWREVLDVAARVALGRYIATGDGLHHVAEGGPPPVAGSSPAHTLTAKQRRRSEAHLDRGDHDRSRKADVDSTIDDIAASAQVALSEASGAYMQPPSTMRNAQYVSQRVDFAAIESLYHTSSKLSGSAVLDFVSALCLVSADELANGERIYSLQRLVEVAHYNMDRVRWSWSRIWSVLAHHFESVCQSSNVGLAQFALDALRQLSIKFLAKDELANFTFQKEFLRPFERVMLSRPSVSIRELVIRCVSQMVYARAANIRSGWKSIFAVYTAAASDDNEGIVLLAFETVERIMLDFFDLIANRWFVETVHCLAAFGNNNLFKEIGLKALASLERCAQQLAEGKVRWPADLEEGMSGSTELEAGGPLSTSTSVSFSVEDGFTDSPEHIGLWFPILIGLARITSHPHIDVRSSAVEALFRVLSTHGQAFSEPLWRLIFSGVLLPIFDSVLGLEPGETDEEWLNTTCLIALRSLVSLVTDSPPDSTEFMVDATLDLFTGLQKHGNPALTELTSACLLEFVARNMDNNLNWMRVMQTELSVIETGWETGNARMVEDAVGTIVRIADSQHAVVHPDAMIAVFEALTALDDFSGEDMIASHQLQTRITRAALTIGFRSFEAQPSTVVRLAESAARRYGERGAELVDELPGTSEDRDEALRQCDAVINSLLVCVLALDDETIQRHVRLLYSVLVSLVAVDAPELRQLVAQGLRRLGAVCFDLPDASEAGVKSDA